MIGLLVVLIAAAIVLAGVFGALLWVERTQARRRELARELRVQGVQAEAKTQLRHLTSEAMRAMLDEARRRAR
jgi:hypothetical protein